MATVPSSTVLKAFQVLELFAERPLLGVADAARMLGVRRDTPPPAGEPRRA